MSHCPMLVAVTEAGVASAFLQTLAATIKAYKMAFDRNSTALSLLLEEVCAETDN